MSDNDHLHELQIRNAVGIGWIWGTVTGATTALALVGAFAGWPKWIPGLLALACFALLAFAWTRVEDKAVEEARGD